VYFTAWASLLTASQKSLALVRVVVMCLPIAVESDHVRARALGAVHALWILPDHVRARALGAVRALWILPDHAPGHTRTQCLQSIHLDLQDR
jgi:hypothetical protein